MGSTLCLLFLALSLFLCERVEYFRVRVRMCFCDWIGEILTKFRYYCTSNGRATMFGSEFEKIWPVAGSSVRLTDFERKLLAECKSVKKPTFAADIDLREFIIKSSKFPIEFGTNTCRVISQSKERQPYIQQQIASAYPIIHERVLHLYLSFLQHKCLHGNKVELDIYPKLSLIDFVQRLLTKRCVTFFGRNDQFLLLTRESGVGGFEEIGTDAEKPPLLLATVLSYDEIKLSALLAVSSHTEFINDGHRENRGVVETNRARIESSGVVVGIVGPRFERPGLMEFQDMVISKVQNTAAHGYGDHGESTHGGDDRTKDYRRLWKRFYEEDDFLYETVVKDDERFVVTQNKNYLLDNVMLKKRYTIAFDTLLLECEARAARSSQSAFLHVVGFGLGVWRISDSQEQIFLHTFGQRLTVLAARLPHLDVVHFSWFQSKSCGVLKDDGLIACESHPKGGIRTFLSKRCPNEKLKMPEQEGLLLVVSYAWDGNAQPGNEFWMKMLSATNDPSTACSTLIAELHNPHINSLMVNGSNLHVASEQHGVIHISEYARKILD